MTHLDFSRNLYSSSLRKQAVDVESASKESINPSVLFKRSIGKIALAGLVVVVALISAKFCLLSKDVNDKGQEAFVDADKAKKKAVKFNMMPDTHVPFSTSFPNGNKNLYSSVNDAPSDPGNTPSVSKYVVQNVKKEKQEEAKKKGILEDAFGGDLSSSSSLSYLGSPSNSTNSSNPGLSLPDPDTNHDGKVSEAERAEAATQKYLAEMALKNHPEELVPGSCVLEFCKHRKILAFGDSLTYGKCDQDVNGHPYTLRLNEKFYTLGRNITAVNEGLSGERSHEMVKRIPVVLHNVRPAYTIILGGSNDLAHSKITAIEILDQIIQLHRQALILVTGSHAAYGTVPVTIPKLESKTVNETARLEINAAIKLYSQKCLHSPVLDLGNQWKDYEKYKDMWSADHIHFSAKGYDAVGDMIFDLFQKWIVKRGEKPELRMKAENPSGKEFINTSRNVAVAIMNQLRNGIKFNSTGC